MSNLIHEMDRKLYPEYQENWDNKLFRNILKQSIEANTLVFDVGAGAGIVPEMNFSHEARRVYGVDLDSRIVTNPYCIPT